MIGLGDRGAGSAAGRTPRLTHVLGAPRGRAPAAPGRTRNGPGHRPEGLRRSSPQGRGRRRAPGAPRPCRSPRSRPATGPRAPRGRTGSRPRWPRRTSVGRRLDRERLVGEGAMPRQVHGDAPVAAREPARAAATTGRASGGCRGGTRSPARPRARPRSTAGRGPRRIAGRRASSGSRARAADGSATVLDRPEGRLGAAREVELAEDVRDVRARRPLGDVEQRRDLLVRVALRDERQDLALALGQRLGAGASSRRLRIRFASSRATCGSRWTSPACARRTATATSSASASLSR